MRIHGNFCFCFDAHKAHYFLKGAGDTAIVFVEGSGTPCAYTDFYNLQDEFSNSYTTLSFDRAGCGWSESTDVPRNIDQLNDELAVLIEKTVGEKPIILVCHSLGSLETLHYAQTYSNRVKGIVFIDCGSPQFYCNDSEYFAKLLNLVNSFSRITGLSRLFGETGNIFPLYGEKDRNLALPEKLRSLDKAMYYWYVGNPAVRPYVDCMNENAKIVCNGKKLGQIPILVLSSDSGDKWKKVQQELALWSENATQITIKNSGHYLHHTNYEEVLLNISLFLEKCGA